MTPDVTSSSPGDAGSSASYGGTQRFQQLFARYKILALLLAVAAIWIFFSFLTHGAFVTPRNLSNLLRQMSITGMLACGMVFVIIAGEIDLSVGSLLGLLGGVAAILDVNRYWPLAATLPAVMLLGVLIGMFNGGCSRIAAFCSGSPAARRSRRSPIVSCSSVRVICRELPAICSPSCCLRCSRC